MQADPLGLKGCIALYAYADDDPIGESDPLGLFAQLLCRQVTVNGLTGVKKAVVKAYKPVHCRLRVKCGCGGTGSFDTTVGRENINPAGSPGIYALTNESSNAFSSPTWKTYPVDGTGPNCEFERCVLKAFVEKQDKPGLTPAYNALGPNSNTFVHDLFKQCGGSAAEPPGAVGYNWP